MKRSIQFLIFVSLIGSLLGKVIHIKRDSGLNVDEPVVAEYRGQHTHEASHHEPATSYQNVVLHSYHPKVVHYGKHDHKHH